MGERTIPEPSEDELTIARVAMRFSVSQTGLDWDDPEVQKLVDLVAASSAQRSAEIRWLRNMMHDPLAFQEFLEARNAKDASTDSAAE